MALGFETQADFCRSIDIAPNRWNQYETGERPITVTVAVKIAERHGIPLDYIYRDDPQGLPKRIADKLLSEPAE